MIRIRAWMAVGVVSLAAGLLAGRAGSAADDLPRKAALGVVLAPVPDDVRAAQKLKPSEGVLVREALAGSTAQAAGLEAGDVLVKLGGTVVDNPGTVVRALGGLTAGKSLVLEIVRNGERLQRTTLLKERPREQSGQFEVLYGSVTSHGARLRTVVTLPKTSGPHPALFLIQGLGCYSVDNPPPGDTYRRLMYDFAEHGYVTMRVDKPGCGDSEGGPCLDNDFETVLDGYRQALLALKKQPGVDPERVFIFGHSMGGIMGPILTSEIPVRGLATYGTAVRPWEEYMLENTRRQLLLAGASHAEVDRRIRSEMSLYFHFFHEKKSPAEIAALGPELKALVAEEFAEGKYFAGRHYRFFQQLNDKNLAEYWERGGAAVLTLWGKSDYVTSGEDHAAIAEIVNLHRTGKGTYRMLEGIDHFLSKAASQQESFNRHGAPGEFNPLILQALHEWMDPLARPN